MKHALLRPLAGTVLAAAAMLSLPSTWAQNRGLSASPEQLGSPVWRARVERDASLPGVGPATPLWMLAAPMPQALRLLGDYQSSLLRLGATGGLRLTGGVLLHLRPLAAGGLGDWPAGPLSGSGYAGVGYSSAGVMGDWGFSADLGLTAGRFGPSSSGSGIGSGNGLRDGRPQPLLRLGMNWQF